MDVNLYNQISSTVVSGLNSNSYKDNVLRHAYLDNNTDTVVRQPDGIESFSKSLSENPPYSTLGSIYDSSNIVKIIQNFIPTAQETSEYSGKTTNWLENSILLMLPQLLPTSQDDDLPAENYTSFVNRNVKVFILMDVDTFSKENNMSWTSGKMFQKLAAVTNGHFLVVKGENYNQVVSDIMKFGYSQDLIYTRNLAETTFMENMGKFKTPKSTKNGENIQLFVTISEDFYPNNPKTPLKLSMRFVSPTGQNLSIDFLQNRKYNESNFYTSPISLLPNTEYTLSIDYSPYFMNIHNLLIRIWTPRVNYQYAEYVNLSFEPTQPDNMEGAAFRMTLLNNCYQNENAQIVITDCRGTVSRKYDSTQMSGIPIGTEGSYPKFAFVPFFCDYTIKYFCIEGTENKYDVQVIVGSYSISRSFQCLSNSEPFNPQCQHVDENGNYYCTRNQLPYKRGPTGKLTDCLGNGELVFDSSDTQDYICQCHNGYSGVSCQNKK